MRLENLEQFGVETTLAEVLRNIEDLKKRQRIGGRNLVINCTTTDDTWDVDETVSGSALLAQWRVTFTPDTVDRPYAEIAYEWFVTPDSGFNDGLFDAYPDPANISSNAVSFLVDYSNPNLSDVNVKLKFGIKSADTGTITWQRLPDS